MESENSLYYITIATKPHKILTNIQQHLEKTGDKVIVLGETENRNIGWHSTGNFGIKIREVQKFVANPELRDNDIILFTDAYDVICAGNISDACMRFKNMGCQILFGGETSCNPMPELKKHYNNTQEEFSFLNSGLFIGYVKTLRILLNNYEYNDNHDDQVFWTIQYLNNPNLISIDYHNEIFLNTYGLDIKEINWNGNTAIYKGRNPLFIHVNGPDKTELNNFIN